MEYLKLNSNLSTLKIDNEPIVLFGINLEIKLYSLGQWKCPGVV